MRVRTVLRTAVPVVLLSLALGACGDDDKGDAKEATSTDTTEICKLAKEIFEDEDGIPSTEQLEKYTELAPDEIKDAVDVAGPPLIAADGDQAKFFVAVADDDVEKASNEINDWERENCGIDHEEATPAAVTKVDPDAHRVDVTASEYTFAFDKKIPAGPVSFVMKNAGKEVHFMTFARINDGHTIQEALSFDGDPEEAGILESGDYDSNLAAPGGDEETVTLDLEAGNWAMFCFVPGPDGIPHAMSGMAVPFTVS